MADEQAAMLQERERSRDHQREQQQIQAAFADQTESSESFVREILDSSDVRKGDASDLQEVTVTKLESMLSRQWMLANLSDAQEHDIRWKLEVIKLKIMAVHPPEESCITGATRAFLYDDEMEELQPLTQQERLVIDEFIETIKAMVTRGRGGFERKQMNTSIAQTETKKESTQSDSKWQSLFG